MAGIATHAFGALLRRYRTDRGLTQEDLAERAGLSVRGISDLERGVNRAPYQATIERLIDALELSDGDRAALQAAGSRRRGLAVHAPEPPARMLPIPPTLLVGRERDEAAAVHLLRWEGRRLLTFTGAGGVGKTRLALQVAKTVSDDFADGVVFVDLAPIGNPTLVAASIAATLVLREQKDVSLREGLIAFLRDREILLVLDNFEQVVEGAPLVSEMLMACPKLKTLVTSRISLRLRGEQELTVAPLASLPADGRPEIDELLRCPAIALFVQRARLVKPEFALTPDNAAAVAEICRRVDGLPLAIELAAVRVKFMNPQALLARLAGAEGGAPLDALAGGPRDLPQRQQTMRNTIAWSYSLLQTEEQALLRRLSLFVGGAQLEAVKAVCDTPDSVDVLDTVFSLVDQSLLQTVEVVGTEPRFRMLETVREYGLEMLASSGEAERARWRHARHFVRLAEDAEVELSRRNQARWLARLDLEHDNLRVVLDWLLQAGREREMALRLAGSLAKFWFVRGYLSEGRRWLEEALQRGGEPSPARAKALLGAGILAEGQGEYERARLLVTEGLQLYREQGDKVGIASALMHLGVFAQYQGSYDEAAVLNAESLELFRELGDCANVAQVLNNLGMAAQDHGEFCRAAELYEEGLALSRDCGDIREVGVILLNLGLATAQQREYERAAELYAESLSIFKELGDTRVVAIVLLNLGEVAMLQGDYEGAASPLRENLTLSVELGGKRNIAYSLEALGRLFVGRGDLERGLRLWGAAEALREASHMPLPPALRAQFERDLLPLRSRVGEDAWAAAWGEGRAMTVDQAVAEALREGLE